MTAIYNVCGVRRARTRAGHNIYSATARFTSCRTQSAKRHTSACVRAPAERLSTMSIRMAAVLLWLGSCLVVIGCARDPINDLMGKLQDPNVEIRRLAARALDAHAPNDDRVIAALAKSVADADTDVRYDSIDALGKLGPSAKSSLPALIAALRDQEKPIRLRASLSIEEIDPQDRSYVPVLEGALREGDGRILLEVAAMG